MKRGDAAWRKTGYRALELTPPICALSIRTRKIDPGKLANEIVELGDGDERRRAPDEFVRGGDDRGQRRHVIRPGLDPIARKKASFDAARSFRAASATSRGMSPSACFSRMSSPCHQPAMVGRSCVVTQATDLGG